MDQNVMNTTRNLMNKFKQGRVELSRADGQTKDRVEVWRKNLHGLTDDLIKQSKLLDELDNGGTKTAEGGGELKKDFFDHLVTQLSKEIQDLMTICKNVLSLPQQYANKQKKENIENQWRIITDSMKNEVTKVLGFAQDPNSDHMALISKLMNLKDHLQKQEARHLDGFKYLINPFVVNIIYIEISNQMSLCTQVNPFSLLILTISEVVEAINTINDLKEQLHYIPSKIFYNEVDLNSTGIYSINNENASDSVPNLEALCDGFVEMENLIKKNFKLSSEKLMKFTDSNPVQITLREELELVYKQKNLLEDENQNLKLSLIANRENDSKNLLELHQSVEKLKNELQIQQLNNEDKMRTIKNMEGLQIKLKHQLETRKYQKDLAAELEKIKQDAELLPSMFRAEAVFRNQCKKEKDDAEETMKDAVKKYQSLLKERDDLKHELERKERLSLQAIAARSNMKTHLDQASQSLKESENQNRIEAEEDVNYYKRKHDEMFQSVSALNKRIEELESHKMHLLDKLKSQGDKGGLEYIVKTQKLEHIKGKELQDRVVVEDYRPELNRSRHQNDSNPNMD